MKKKKRTDYGCFYASVRIIWACVIHTLEKQVEKKVQVLIETMTTTTVHW